MRPSWRIGKAATIVAQHKPLGFLSPSTRPVGNKKFAIDLLTASNLRGSSWRRNDDPRDVPGLQCAGRLDADSTGLLLWSDDDKIVQHIIGPSTPVEKEYLVRVSGHEDWTERQVDESLSLLRSGIELDGHVLLPATVRRMNEHQLQFVLREGKHRQVRRMCAVVGLQVDAIKRVRIGSLKLASLKTGCWSPLSPAQAASLLIGSAARGVIKGSKGDTRAPISTNERERPTERQQDERGRRTTRRNRASAEKAADG